MKIDVIFFHAGYRSWMISEHFLHIGTTWERRSSLGMTRSSKNTSTHWLNWRNLPVKIFWYSVRFSLCTNTFRNLHFTYAWSEVPTWNSFFPTAFMHDFLVHQIFICSSRLAVKFNETLNSSGYTRLPKEQEKLL